jgi:hypothetical protein
MAAALIQCPKCFTTLGETILNQPDLASCPGCGQWLQVEVFPALFRKSNPGQRPELLMVEGESSCFYHPQKKAVIPCDSCGRFLCALCDCHVKDQHLCPACLQSGQKKTSIAGLEDMRALHSRQALILSILPFFLTGVAAIIVALRYRKEPGSLVQPMTWAFPVALVLGSLQVLFFLTLIAFAFFK